MNERPVFVMLWLSMRWDAKPTPKCLLRDTDCSCAFSGLVQPASVDRLTPAASALSVLPPLLLSAALIEIELARSARYFNLTTFLVPASLRRGVTTKGISPNLHGCLRIAIRQACQTLRIKKSDRKNQITLYHIFMTQNTTPHNP